MEWFIVTAILITVHIFYLKREKISGYIIRNRNLGLTADKTWDDEWLAAEKRRHSISAIEPCPLYFIGDKEKKHPHDGYRWYCECGKVDAASSLSRVDAKFEKHTTAEHEKALAAINRTK